MLLKIQNPILKYLVSSKLPKKTCFEKRKMFLCIRLSISKLKNHMVFFIQKKNNVLACILALITSLLELREHWPKFQKQQKFCLSFRIRGTILHIIHIPDIKCFSNVRTVRFYPIKDKNLLIEEGFS
jgi:hypothetical protein